MTSTFTRLMASAGVAAAAIALASPASAATYMFTYANGNITGSGTITTGATNPAGSFGTPSELITAITGTFNNRNITGLLAPGSFYNNDNILYYPSLGTFMNQPTYLDIRGLAFSNELQTVNLYFGLGGYGHTIERANGNIVNNFGGTFTLTPTAAVPEPATWGLMILGFGMVGAGMRYRRRATKVSFA